MGASSYVIGYGTFILRSARQSFNLKPLDVVPVYGYQRVYHPHLPYRFPFVLSVEREKYFKGILFQIPQKGLEILDNYEGVPTLYNRVKYSLSTVYSPCFLYVPSDSVERRLEADIQLYLTPGEEENLYNTDLWLNYLQEAEPELMQEFPDLFIP